MPAPWRISDEAVGLLRRPRLDLRPTDAAFGEALAELEEIAVYLVANREPKERSDGALIYRGRKSQRFQYIVRGGVLESVRREGEWREGGPHGRRIGGRDQ